LLLAVVVVVVELVLAAVALAVCWNTQDNLLLLQITQLLLARAAVQERKDLIHNLAL
jgi:hypothetical protein